VLVAGGAYLVIGQGAAVATAKAAAVQAAAAKAAAQAAGTAQGTASKVAVGKFSRSAPALGEDPEEGRALLWQQKRTLPSTLFRKRS
jgi:hypothetical protein